MDPYEVFGIHCTSKKQGSEKIEETKGITSNRYSKKDQHIIQLSTQNERDGRKTKQAMVNI